LLIFFAILVLTNKKRKKNMANNRLEDIRHI